MTEKSALEMGAPLDAEYVPFFGVNAEAKVAVVIEQLGLGGTVNLYTENERCCLPDRSQRAEEELLGYDEDDE